MTRQELVRAISERTGLSRTDAAAALEAFITVVQESLVNGEPITLRGFGSFNLKFQRARKGRVIHTGQAITIPPRLRVAFQPSNQLQSRIQNNPTLLKRLAKE
ncbi:MAG: HU family DNA-binding protein [Bacteroidia bacterium]|nr:HU family DNA-binding protein [Bacteroidia bacterium]MDW8134285.1 HU family DNA-binding protein [Bacteroidia bacterium]